MAKVADFRPATKNANKHSARGLGALQKSVQSDGWIGAMTTAADGEMIAGSARIETAAQVFGVDAEPIVIESDGTRPIIVKRTDIPQADDPRAVRLALADNRVQELDLTWDVEVLAGLDADVLDGLWTADELSDLGQQWADEQRGKQDDPGAQIDKAEELQAKWNVQPGDLWQLGAHRLVCGDCTDAAVVERVMGGEKAGAVVTDPPYGQDQLDVPGDSPEGHAELMAACVKVLPIDNGIVIAFQSPRMFPDWLAAISGHQFKRALWLYKEAQETFPWRGWILKSEMILVSEIGKGEWVETHPYAHDCYKVSEVSYRTEQIAAVRAHGSVKPLSVVQDLVSRVGGIIYDPFLGSGTTLIACECLGRKCRAVEIAPKYVAVTLDRWATMTGQTPVLVSGNSGVAVTPDG